MFDLDQLHSYRSSIYSKMFQWEGDNAHRNICLPNVAIPPADALARSHIAQYIGALNASRVLICLDNPGYGREVAGRGRAYNDRQFTTRDRQIHRGIRDQASTQLGSTVARADRDLRQFHILDDRGVRGDRQRRRHARKFAVRFLCRFE